MPAIVPTELPDDLNQLKSLVVELCRDIDQYQMRIAYLTRRLFGRSSERFDEKDLTFFDLEDQGGLQTATVAEPASAPVEEVADEKEKPAARGNGRKRAPKDLPRRRIVYDLSPEEKICKNCCIQKRCIGEEVSEQYNYIPAQLEVIEHARLKYACDLCEGEVAIADKPPQPIEKGNATAGLLTQVIISKYCDHLPLYRQEKIFSRLRIPFSRQTMDNWVLQCADLLKSLWVAMCLAVIRSPILNTDDTSVPVQVKKKGRTHRAFLWVYIGDAEQPLTVYDFTWTRSREGPEKFLDAFEGYLQADAFSGYDRLYTDETRSIVEVGCWAHCRRKYFDARQTDPVRAHIVIRQIKALYKVETDAMKANLDSAATLLLRAERSRPILDELKQWAEQQDVLPKSPIGQAITYMLNQWSALKRYLEDGRLSIDNNVAERALRGCVLGRKNWLFAGSERGGQAAAIFYSLIQSAIQNGHEPFAYLRDVLERIPTHPINRIQELMPNNWKPQDPSS